MSDPNQDPRRHLPSVDAVLQEAPVAGLSALYGRRAVRAAVRAELDELRRAAAGSTNGGALEARVARLPQRIERRLAAGVGDRLQRVINATGIFVHTNLGRSPLPAEVAAALPALADAYCDLELDLDSGRRGDRNRRVERLLVELTGAEAALVVNNNAAALVLALAGLARDREVVISRGELVEIGGSFRIPDILGAAGARLVEVGTTNRTRLADYAAAVGPDTALLLKVHPSNYRMSGFVAAVEPAELVALARERGIAVLVDEGSGLLRPHPAPQLEGHASLEELVAAGCDLACGSGDKLLGGPQAGLLVGRAEVVGRLKRHPLYRALRPDRLSLASLEAVLKRHLAGREMPLSRLWPDPQEHHRRLERLAGELAAEIVPADAYVGGGAAPDRPVAGEALALDGGERLLAALRRGSPPVVGYVRDDRVILDARTVAPADEPALVAAVKAARRALAAS